MHNKSTMVCKQWPSRVVKVRSELIILTRPEEKVQLTNLGSRRTNTFQKYCLLTLALCSQLNLSITEMVTYVCLSYTNMIKQANLNSNYYEIIYQMNQYYSIVFKNICKLKLFS